MKISTKYFLKLIKFVKYLGDITLSNKRFYQQKSQNPSPIKFFIKRLGKVKRGISNFGWEQQSSPPISLILLLLFLFIMYSTQSIEG